MPSDDRRPITVMHILYRLFAKKHADHLSDWMISWKLHGWELESILPDARLVRRPLPFFLNMDLSKCHDRLDVGNLRSICDKLKLPSCFIAFRNCQQLNRFLFVDSRTTDV